MIESREKLLELISQPGATDEIARQRILSALVQPSPYISYEEFLEWADEDTLAEWENGEIIMTSPASSIHQLLAGFLYRLVLGFVEKHGLGIVYQPPFQMKLATSGREPDLIFVAQANQGRVTHTYLDGPADLVVEITSPESMNRDRGQKFYEYERASIPEYWLIDPLAQRAEFYQLGANGQYATIFPNEDSIYHARQLPGFWLRLAWLWQAPLPTPDDALFEISGEAYARQMIERLQQKGYLK